MKIKGLGIVKYPPSQAENKGSSTYEYGREYLIFSNLIILIGSDRESCS